MIEHTQISTIRYDGNSHPVEPIVGNCAKICLPKPAVAEYGSSELINLRPQQRLTIELLLSRKELTLTSGVVAVDVQVNKGQRQILDFLMPGDILPTMLPLPKNYSVRAINSSTLRAACAGKPAESYGCCDPGTAPSARSLEQFARAELKQLMIGYLETEARVASFLLLQAARSCNATNRTLLSLPMSRDDVADYLAMNHDTLSRNMMRLDSSGIVKRLNRRTLLILDLNRLKNQTPLADTITDYYSKFRAQPSA